MALIDTDVLIWIQRGNEKAARLVQDLEERAISIQTMMELLQCARGKDDHKLIMRFIRDMGIRILPLTENIGHRALIYVEQLTISSGMRAGDAIIAATAIENHLSLCTGNVKHFKIIEDLDLIVFKP